MSAARCLSLVLLVAPAAAPAQGDRAFEQDVAFARALASRLAYVDLAEGVAASIDRSRLSPAELDELDLLACDLAALGARRAPSSAERRELYDRAASDYEAFLDGSRGAGSWPRAWRSYAELLDDATRELESELGASAGSEASALREELARELDRGLERLERFAVLPSAIASGLERSRVELSHGQLLLRRARIADDRAPLLERASRILESLALDAGETSGIGLDAYVLLAQIRIAQGEPGSALDFAEFVFQVALPDTAERQDELGWSTADLDEKTGRFRLAELDLPVLVEAYELGGVPERACAAVLQVFDVWKRERLELSTQGGWALLAGARLFLDARGTASGDPEQGTLVWSDAEEAPAAGGRGARPERRRGLDLAQLLAHAVLAERPSGALQARAQSLLAAVAARPEAAVSPELLLEIAQGALDAGDSSHAIEALKRVLHATETLDPEERRSWMPRVLFALGSAYAGAGRRLEAAQAFREGATRWGGDPAYQEKLARGYYAALDVLRDESGNDPLLVGLAREAEELLSAAATSSSDRAEILFRQAERKVREEQDYAGARELYGRIEAGSELHALAVAQAAQCQYKEGDLAGAREAYERCLAEAAAEGGAPASPTARASRASARALATYGLGRIAHEQGDSARVIELLGAFDDAFPAQTEYAPNALFMVVVAHLARGEVARAEDVAARMRRVFAAHPKTGSAAIQVYQALKVAQEEARAAGDAARTVELGVRMADALHVSNELAETPRFQNLRAESSLWIELGRWADAEAVLRRIVALFGASAAEHDELERFVLPDLGRVLLEQRRVPDAFAILDPLVPSDPADPRRPSARVVRGWCRAVAGWVELEGDALVEVPGVGGPAELRRATELLARLLAAEKQAGAGAWSCPWYELTFESAYAYDQWGQSDSAQLENARKIVQSLTEFLGDERLEDVTARCGDDSLRRRFLWLRERLR